MRSTATLKAFQWVAYATDFYRGNPFLLPGGTNPHFVARSYTPFINTIKFHNTMITLYLIIMLIIYNLIFLIKSIKFKIQKLGEG